MFLSVLQVNVSTAMISFGMPWRGAPLELLVSAAFPRESRGFS